MKHAFLLVPMVAVTLLCNVTQVGTASPQSPSSYVGQVRILRSDGGKRTHYVSGKLAEISEPGCNSVVEVIRASIETTGVAFHLKEIGRPIPNGSVGCFGAAMETDLRIADAGMISAGELDSALKNLLMTPESYLAYLGIEFGLTPRGDETPAPTGPGTTNPRVLLRINPGYSEEGEKERVAGVVRVEVTVGTDGRIHSPMILNRIGFGLDEQVLRVLPLWRFEPGRQNGQAVPLKTIVELNFRLF